MLLRGVANIIPTASFSNGIESPSGGFFQGGKKSHSLPCNIRKELGKWFQI
jgi:hypothetical protein